MAVTKRTRFEVLRRDNYTCRYCHSADRPLTVDHVLPVALGGADTADNLVAACRDCNHGKASTGPGEATVAQVDADAVRWAAAVRRASGEAAEVRAALLRALDPIAAEFGRFLPADWTATAANWLRDGLTAEEARECVSIAVCTTSVPRDAIFPYACGVARNKLAPIQARARQLFNEGTA